MIFQYTLEQVLSGHKTHTSRLINPNDRAITGKNGKIEAVLNNGRDKYRVGKTYAVQPARGKPAVARIRLLGIERKNIADTTVTDAKHEGFATKKQFLAEWQEIHGENQLNADVWMLEFELVGDKG